MGEYIKKKEEMLKHLKEKYDFPPVNDSRSLPVNKKILEGM